MSSQPPGSIAYQLAFQISPVILTNGIATFVGGYLPIVLLTEGISFVGGILSGGGLNTDLNTYFANFLPLSGSTLIDNQIGKYPFANQNVAANAIIVQPLVISLLMLCPSNADNPVWLKLGTMTLLQSVLAQHNVSGGTYIVATPSFVYTNCILKKITDVSTGESHQRQIRYQWDFEQPLLTLNQAQAAQNSLMSQLSAGTQVSGDPPSASGLSTGVGNAPALGGVGTLPSATPSIGAGAGAAPLSGAPASGGPGGIPAG